MWKVKKGERNNAVGVYQGLGRKLSYLQSNLQNHGKMTGFFSNAW